MKTLSSLQDFFYENIYNSLSFLEEKRVKIYSYLKKVAIILFILTIAILYFTQDFIFNSPNFLFIIIAAAVAIFSFIYKIEVSGFAFLYKEQVIRKLVSFIDKSLVYEKQNFISESEFKKSSIFPQRIDRFGGDDLVYGNISGVNVKFSEVHCEKKEKNSKNKTYWRTIFKGMFFIADFNKNFHGKTIILPDNSERFLGSLSHFFQSFTSKGELIKMDNPEFEKAFVVYSNDQIEARYILSHSLMDSILDYKKVVGKSLSISFVGSKIYIAIPFKDKLFEPKIYKSVTSFDEVQLYFKILSFTVDIVNKLKLDRKIWSKR